ncbi:MAG TPA: hypothetical protein VKR06_02940 [Ktedonosporobacter sp.]|nr:hypothetical protein [Ktedonosporobacter sp.]
MKRFLFSSSLLLSLVLSLLAGMAYASPHARASSLAISGLVYHFDLNGANEIAGVAFVCDAGDTAVLVTDETDLSEIESGNGTDTTTCTGTTQILTFSMIELGRVRLGDHGQGTLSLVVFSLGIEVGSADVSGPGTVTKAGPGTVTRASSATPSLTLRVEICLNSGFCLQIIN